MSAASSIAISSPPTSKSGLTVRSRCSTSASPKRSGLTCPPTASTPLRSVVRRPKRASYWVRLRTWLRNRRPASRSTDADVWAFGCLLFEMLTGERPFQGDTAPETLAAVLRSDPDWRRLPAGTSTDLRNLMRRCLRKDPRQRLQAIGDARIILEDVLAGSPDVEKPVATGARLAGRRGWELAGAATVAALVGVAAWSLKPAPASPQPVRSFTITLPPGQHLASLSRGGVIHVVLNWSEDLKRLAPGKNP